MGLQEDDILPSSVAVEETGVCSFRDLICLEAVDAVVRLLREKRRTFNICHLKITSTFALRVLGFNGKWGIRPRQNRSQATRKSRMFYSTRTNQKRRISPFAKNIPTPKIFNLNCT